MQTFESRWSVNTLQMSLCLTTSHARLPSKSSTWETGSVARRCAYSTAGSVPDGWAKGNLGGAKLHTQFIFRLKFNLDLSPIALEAERSIFGAEVKFKVQCNSSQRQKQLNVTYHSYILNSLKTTIENLLSIMIMPLFTIHPSRNSNPSFCTRLSEQCAFPWKSNDNPIKTSWLESQHPSKWIPFTNYDEHHAMYCQPSWDVFDRLSGNSFTLGIYLGFRGERFPEI